MIGDDDDRFAFGEGGSGLHWPMTSAAASINAGLFDDFDDDRIDSDGNPLDPSEDEDFGAADDLFADDLPSAEDDPDR